MSTEQSPVIGTVVGTDLTVDNAEEVHDFYAGVIGWEFESLTVEDHEDYVMKTPAGNWVVGICHRSDPT